MTAQVDQFCAWAQPSDGTYINADAWSALSVWRAAQTHLATALIPQPGGTLLTAGEVGALASKASRAAMSGLPKTRIDQTFARYIEAAVLQKQCELFAASLAQEMAP